MLTWHGAKPRIPDILDSFDNFLWCRICNGCKHLQKRIRMWLEIKRSTIKWSKINWSPVRWSFYIYIILYIYILYIYIICIYIYTNPRGHSTPPSWEWPLSAWSIWKTTVASDSQQSPAPGYSQGIQSSKFYTSWGSWGPGQPRGSPGFCPGARRGANPAKNWQKDGRRSNNSKWGVALMVGKLVKN